MADQFGYDSLKKAKGIGPATPDTNQLKAIENLAMEMALGTGVGSLGKVLPFTPRLAKGDPHSIAEGVKRLLDKYLTNAPPAEPSKWAGPHTPRSQQIANLNEAVRALDLPRLRGFRHTPDPGDMYELAPRTAGQYAKLARGLHKSDAKFAWDFPSSPLNPLKDVLDGSPKANVLDEIFYILQLRGGK